MSATTFAAVAQATGRTVTVDTTAALTAALGAASPGETILLAPGTYGPVSVYDRNFSTAVTIASQEASDPAVLTGLAVTHSTGLTLDDLECTTAGAAIGPYGAEATYDFEFLSDSNLTLTKLNVAGAADGTLATDISGLLIEGSRHVLVSDSTFYHLHNALDQFGNRGVVIRGNSFSYIWDDGIRGGGTSDILVENNKFTTFHMDPADTDHPDAIQFWTSNTSSDAKNITIIHNTYTRGAGNPIQGIFIEDELGDLPYQDVTVKDNNISGGIFNGIYLQHVQNAHVYGNTVTSYDGQDSNFDLLNSSNVFIENNAALHFTFDDDSNITAANNQINAPIPIPGTAARITDGAASGPTPNGPTGVPRSDPIHHWAGTPVSGLIGAMASLHVEGSATALVSRPLQFSAATHFAAPASI